MNIFRNFASLYIISLLFSLIFDVMQISMRHTREVTLFDFDHNFSRVLVLSQKIKWLVTRDDLDGINKIVFSKVGRNELIISLEFFLAFFLLFFFFFSCFLSSSNIWNFLTNQRSIYVRNSKKIVRICSRYLHAGIIKGNVE